MLKFYKVACIQFHTGIRPAGPSLVLCLHVIQKCIQQVPSTVRQARLSGILLLSTKQFLANACSLVTSRATSFPLPLRGSQENLLSGPEHLPASHSTCQKDFKLSSCHFSQYVFQMSYFIHMFTLTHFSRVKQLSTVLHTGSARRLSVNPCSTASLYKLLRTERPK